MVTKTKNKPIKRSEKPKISNKSSKLDDLIVVCGVLQYFFPVGQIWFVIDDSMKRNKFVTFHLKQSLILLITSVLVSVLLLIIPFLWPLGQLFLIFLWVVGLIAAIKGELKELPLVGKFTSHFKF